MADADWVHPHSIICTRSSCWYRAGGPAPVAVLLFLEGVGVMLCLVPSNTYMLDLSGPRGGDTVRHIEFIDVSLKG